MIAVGLLKKDWSRNTYPWGYRDDSETTHNGCITKTLLFQKRLNQEISGADLSMRGRYFNKIQGNRKTRGDYLPSSTHRTPAPQGSAMQTARHRWMVNIICLAQPPSTYSLGVLWQIMRLQNKVCQAHVQYVWRRIRAWAIQVTLPRCIHLYSWNWVTLQLITILRLIGRFSSKRRYQSWQIFNLCKIFKPRPRHCRTYPLLCSSALIRLMVRRCLGIGHSHFVF